MSGAVALRRLHVLGTGLIGTSVGLAARAAGVEVELSDPDAHRLALAIARGAGQAVGTASARVDLLVVAAPPAVTGRLVVEALRSAVAATVTHTCSVQTQPKVEIESLLGRARKAECMPHPRFE